MSLFQKTVLKKHLLEANTPEVDAAYKRFSAYFHDATRQQNIRNSKEEQFQEGFLRELFGHIFGYTLNPEPNFNLTTELKNTSNSKKVDGAIVFDGKAIAVIELKGTNTTDLNSIETQAFGYKSNQPECMYVITSNFEKLRFYIDNSIDYEEFNLFTLDREQFNLLYLCLNLQSIQQHLPKRLKDESVSQEDAITKKLYKDYSEFKRALYQNLVELNPEYDKLLLFKKTQKLLDRFLFIFFAEDRLLLPTNLIFRINQEWKNLKQMRIPVSLYERYITYFNDLNVGAKVTLPAFGKKTGDAITAEFEIFAYNGGLFVPDEVLDHVKIDDEVLHVYTEKMSHYDFDSDVDVNILGHIFENSLNEIDEIKSEIEGEAVDKTKTKRKKDGVFYTPKYITKYIVDNTVGKLCFEKKAELNLLDEDYTNDKKIQTKTKKAHLDKLTEYRTWLLQLTICDPACGSGAFLNQALEFLIAEHRYVDELQAKLMGDSLILSDVENSILENNIYGVDLNDESVEIAKLSLWLRTAQKGRKLNSLNNNIKCGNSLIDDPEVAGDKAFSWEKEFPSVFPPLEGDQGGGQSQKRGFDVVIGNPPYVFARENFSSTEKNFFVQTFVSAKYQINTYLLFIEKTVQIINSNANYGLIIPNSWLMVYSGETLRKYLLENCSLNKIVNLEGYSFESVNVETVILLADKGISDKTKQFDVLLNNGNEFYLSHSKNQNEFYGNDGLEFKVFLDNKSDDLSNKISKKTLPLDDLADIKAGLQAYEKDKGDPKQSAQDVINRPYDYNYKFDDSTFKYLDGKDVNRYFVSWSGLFLRYGKHLAAPRTWELFGGKKIIVREITGKFPKCIISNYTEEVYLYNRSNIAIIEKKKSDVSLKYIVSLLNSSLLSYYFMKNTAKSVRKLFPKIILNDLRKFPIKKIKISEQQPFIDKADLMLSLNKDFQTISQKFATYFSANNKLEKLSTKLSNWFELDFPDFIKELNKAIKTAKGTPLTKKDEFEWMELFEENKKKAQELKAEIDQTDKEIDKMVYELYGLTDEEIKIVEGS
jgi:type I restriction-modification system DNA methylase subunit